MSETKDRCMSCERESGQVPLIKVQYTQRELWICPQCLPILIHRPDRLAAVAGEWVKGSSEVEHHH